MKTIDIPTALLMPPTDPSRIDIDEGELQELCSSIAERGLINPVLVKPHGERYEIVAGHRRWLAHVQLNKETVRCTVSDNEDDLKHSLDQIAENFDRSNLSPMEEATTIAKLLSQLDGELMRVARHIHRSVPFVRARLELLDIQPELKELVHRKDLPISTALHLRTIADDDARAQLLHWSLSTGATETVVRSWVDQYHLNKTNDPTAEPTLPPPIIPGQMPVILMPCFHCGTPFPYQQLRIVRSCQDCVTQITATPRAENNR